MTTPTNPEAIDHLWLARAALVQQKMDLDEAIAALDKVIRRMVPKAPAEGGDPYTPPLVLPRETVRGLADMGAILRTANRREVPTVRDAVLRVLGDGQPRKMIDIIRALPAQGVKTQDDTVRSIITKMLKQGQLMREGYGLYRLASAPETQGAPTVRGSLTVTPTAGEEVDVDGTTNVDHQDSVSRPGDPDGHRGASVVGHGRVVAG